MLYNILSQIIFGCSIIIIMTLFCHHNFRGEKISPLCTVVGLLYCTALVLYRTHNVSTCRTVQYNMQYNTIYSQRKPFYPCAEIGRTNFSKYCLSVKHDHIMTRSYIEVYSIYGASFYKT